jgi:hypothetical protein
MTNLFRQVAHYLTKPVGDRGHAASRGEPGRRGPLPGLWGVGERTVQPGRNPYVGSEVLEHFHHAFDAEELWRSVRTQGGQRGGLRAVISSHPHMGDRRLPTSIMLEFPEELIQHDIRIGGNSTDTLLDGLKELYVKDFQDRLRAGDTPRFMAVTAVDLPPNQIRVRMGAAIYVPGPDEKPAWKVQCSLDGAVWPERSTFLIPSGQLLWILGGSADFASTAYADWPFPCELGVAMVARPDSHDLLLTSEPLKDLQIEFNQAINCFQVRRQDLRVPNDDADPILFLRTERLLPVALNALPSRDDGGVGKTRRVSPQRPASNKAVVNGPARDQMQPSGLKETLSAEDEFTHDSDHLGPGPAREVSGQTRSGQEATDFTLLAEPQLDSAGTLFAQPYPGPTARLSLDGIALQRPSNFSAHGVRGLEFGISAQGSVVGSKSALCALRFEVTSQDDVVVTTAAGARALAVGDTLPLARGRHLAQFQSLPEELSRHYLGWLRLPLGRPVYLPSGQAMEVGRHLESLKPLQPLAGTGFLMGDVPAMPGDQMGMSRRHFVLEAEGDNNNHLALQVLPLGGNTVAVLDENMGYLATASSESPFTLRPGHCLVVGHYVWRLAVDG